MIALSVLQIGVDVSKHGGHAYPGLDKVYDDMLVNSEPHGAFNGKAGFAYPNGDGDSTDSMLKARVSMGSIHLQHDAVV